MAHRSASPLRRSQWHSAELDQVRSHHPAVGRIPSRGGLLEDGQGKAVRADSRAAARHKVSMLGRAIGELGRIPKTLHLLNYIADADYRRHCLTQLNRHEARNGLARRVFHGQSGELRQRYREGQEDQLGALGLVVNALVLWTTRYMDAAWSHLRAQGVSVKPEDMARLSPLGSKHFNVLGRYHFELSDAVRRGELRPLRDPNDFEQELLIA